MHSPACAVVQILGGREGQDLRLEQVASDEAGGGSQASAWRDRQCRASGRRRGLSTRDLRVTSGAVSRRGYAHLYTVNIIVHTRARTARHTQTSNTESRAAQAYVRESCVLCVARFLLLALCSPRSSQMSCSSSAGGAEPAVGSDGYHVPEVDAAPSAGSRRW